MWKAIIQAGKWVLSALGIGAAAYTGYEVVTDITSGSSSSSATTTATTSFDWSGLFISLLVAAGITLLIYFIRKKKGK